MQSSPIMALRAAIVLAFMLAIPLVAIINTTLTNDIGTAIFGRKKQAATWPAKGGPGRDKRDEGGGQPSPGDRGVDGPESSRGVAQASKEPGPQRAVAAAQKAAEGPIQPNSTAFNEHPEQVKTPSATVTGVRAVADGGNPTSPLWSDEAPGVKNVTPPEPAAGVTRAAKADLNRGGKPQEALYYGPPENERAMSPLQTTAYSTPSPAPERRAGDDFKLAGALNRLRELGAVYYRLESWGDGGEFFRCSCQVQMGAPQLTRRFEATESSPMAALENVLLQVEIWRARR